MAGIQWKKGSFLKMKVLFWGPHTRDPTVLAAYEAPRFLETLISGPRQVCSYHIPTKLWGFPTLGSPIHSL